MLGRCRAGNQGSKATREPVYLAEQAAEVTAAIEVELRRFGCLEGVATVDE